MVFKREVSEKVVFERVVSRRVVLDNVWPKRSRPAKKAGAYLQVAVTL
jgi:hypothetical protein